MGGCRAQKPPPPNSGRLAAGTRANNSCPGQLFAIPGKAVIAGFLVNKPPAAAGSGRASWVGRLINSPAQTTMLRPTLQPIKQMRATQSRQKARLPPSRTNH